MYYVNLEINFISHNPREFNNYCFTIRKFVFIVEDLQIQVTMY